MIRRFNNFRQTDVIFNEYPQIRHFSLYESAISILENGFLLSRNELKKNIDYLNLDPNIIQSKNILSKDKWWDERKELENQKFGTEDLIFCIPDWYNNSGYETGHGPVMIYLKPSIFEDFKVTLTIQDSLAENINKIYTDKEIQKIYYNILNENSASDYNSEAKKILENLNSKNIRNVFNTSKGRILIEANRFYNKYSEIQIHAKRISTDYIQEIRFTDNYLDEKKSDKDVKKKLISMCKDKKMKFYDNEI